MSNSILDGLSLVDSLGRTILAGTVTTLVLAVGANLLTRARYAAIEKDLDENGAPPRRFSYPVLQGLVRRTEDAARRAPEPGVQALVEDAFQSELRPLLFAERFVRAATGLVIILGLLGTFYGLTSSIGKLVQLVSGDGAGVADVTLGVTSGLTNALSGMAVAFSNSLVGIGSAVILTVLGIFSNPTDRRVALMVRIEAYLDGVASEAAAAEGVGGRAKEGFSESVARLDGVVQRFEAALLAFSTSTRDFTEFNAHLKDNVQRMSLSFGDFSDTLKNQVITLKRGEKGTGHNGAGQ